MKLFFASLLLCAGSTLFAQKDTVYRYYFDSSSTLAKDPGAVVHKLVKAGDDSWHLWAYNYVRNQLSYDEIVTDTVSRKIVNGFYRDYYYGTDVTKDSAVYKDGAKVLLYHYHKNRALMATVRFNTQGDFISVNGWDSIGKSIPDFVYLQPASFPGGYDAWRAYLIKSLQKDKPAAYKAGDISGEVVVDFLVDKEGHITDVVVTRSSGHRELDEHALNIIKKGPDWNPAIQYNKKVIYRQRQTLTYTN